MGFRTDLRLLTIDVLAAAAIVPAGHIHDSRPVPTERYELPALSVFTLATRGEGESALQTAPEFDTRITLTIEVGLDGASDKTVAAEADQLCERVTEVLLCSPRWLQKVQGVPSYASEVKLNAQTDRRTAGGTVTFELAIHEVFEPVIADELRSVHIDVDVIDPAADPNIKYPGPDGRIEARLDIALPAAS